MWASSNLGYAPRVIFISGVALEAHLGGRHSAPPVAFLVRLDKINTWMSPVIDNASYHFFF